VRAAGLSVLYVLSAVVCRQDVLNNIKRLSIEKKDCGRRSILSIDLADGYVVDGVFPSGALTEDFHVRRGWDLHLANQNPDTAHCVQSPTKKPPTRSKTVLPVCGHRCQKPRLIFVVILSSPRRTRSYVLHPYAFEPTAWLLLVVVTRMHNRQPYR